MLQNNVVLGRYTTTKIPQANPREQTGLQDASLGPSATRLSPEIYLSSHLRPVGLALHELQGHAIANASSLD